MDFVCRLKSSLGKGRVKISKLPLECEWGQDGYLQEAKGLDEDEELDDQWKQPYFHEVSQDGSRLNQGIVWTRIPRANA